MSIGKCRTANYKSKISFKMWIRKAIVLLFLFLSLCSEAQLFENQIHSIDSLFEEWNQPDFPGGVVGVMKDGEAVFQKAYGLASLEYLVPNNESTLFNIGSVSKQLTAMGIVLLQQQGKLHFDDEIQKYLPGFPEFKQEITIRHLLHHTSGLRELHDLLALAGWRGDDYRTNEDIYRFMLRQKDMNFKPGDEFMYCNTGYILLAKIIENITGESFPEWMKKSVFESLGLHRTFVEDNYQHIVPNTATSYYHSHDNVFERAEGYWAYTGAGNVYSTAGDLLKWSKNFYDPQRGWEDRFKILQILDMLNDGTENNYAFGLFIDEKFGFKRIQHAGVVGGFRSFVSIYPEERLNIVVLTNFSSAPFGERADQIAKMLLPVNNKSVQADNQQEEQESKNTENQQGKINPDMYTGIFYSPELETQYKIYLKDGELKWHHARHGDFNMHMVSTDQLEGQWPFSEVRFIRDDSGKVTGIRVSNERVKNVWFKKMKTEKY